MKLIKAIVVVLFCIPLANIAQDSNIIEFTPSKTGGEVRRIPITPEFKGMLKDLAAANKSLGKSFDFVDADGISHDFLFWTNEGKVPFKPLLLSSKNATGGLYPSEL